MCCLCVRAVSASLHAESEKRSQLELQTNQMSAAENRLKMQNFLEESIKQEKCVAVRLRTFLCSVSR